MDIYRIMNGLVDNATNESLNAPDKTAMGEVSELVRSRADMPKEVVKLISNKLMKRDKKTTMLSLELLEYLTYTCEITLYNQISTKDFLVKMGNIIRSTDLGEQVILRACCLIKCWRDLFNKDLHQFFFQFYDNVVKRGLEIPANYVSPYSSLKTTSTSSSTNFGSLKSTSTSSTVFNNSSQPVSGPKAKLKSDLEAIKQQITQVNEMIDAQDPKGNVDQNYQLSSLIQTLKSSEAHTQGLIEKLATENDEGLLELCLQINDDMQSTFDRHQSLRKHMKPKPFRGKKVEDEVLKQIESLEISGKNSNSNSESIFANTAQALSQGLAKAQGSKIPPPSQSFTQPPTFVAPPQPIKPAANIIDLLDDDDPVQPVAQNITQTAPVNQTNVYNTNTNQQFPPQNQNQQIPAQNFNQPQNTYVQPPATFVPPQQNYNQPTQVPTGGLTQLYQQQQQQQNLQNQQQNKYSALGQVGQPAMMGGYPPVGSIPYGQNNLPGYNPGAAGGIGASGYSGQQYMGYNNTQATGYGQSTQPQGYGIPPSNNGYGVQNTFSPPPPMGGYGGGLPQTTQIGNNKQGGYGQPATTNKNAFDDLDDMFGIGGNNAPNTKPPQQQGQQQMQPPVSKQVDFDLF